MNIGLEFNEIVEAAYVFRYGYRSKPLSEINSRDIADYRWQTHPASQSLLWPDGPLEGQSLRPVPPPVFSAKAGLAGCFTLSNLPPGGWMVCADAAGYLNPCHWSISPSFNVGSGQTISNADVRMNQAYKLRIGVNDPQGLLNEGKAAGDALRPKCIWFDSRRLSPNRDLGTIRSPIVIGAKDEPAWRRP